MEDQIEAKESKIIKFEKREYLACHILMSTTLTHLRTRMKGLATPKDMWKAIKEDATSKSTLFLINAEDQLSSIKLMDNNNPKTHPAELKQHFQLMLQHCNNLIKIGLVMSDSQFNTIIVSSLPESY
jgi:gag-polypeptide of LTR copia-type